MPKQFLLLNGRPILWYTLNTFLLAYADCKIILVIAADQWQTGENLLQTTNHRDRITLAAGGATRFHSVQNGLQHVQHPSIVFVHDAVRCLLSHKLIHRCFEEAVIFGNAIPAVSAVDSIRLESSTGNEAIPRERVKIIQTPQTFQSDMIKAAYEQPFDETFTDEASVVERLGIKIHLVEGEDTNIKITRPIDLLFAERILDSRKEVSEQK